MMTNSMTKRLPHIASQPLKCGHIYHHECLRELIKVYIKEKRGVVDCPDCRVASSSSGTTEDPGGNTATMLSEEEVKAHVDELELELYQQ